MGKIVKGYWDCPACGTVGISGDERNCPGCGQPRGEGVKFYLKDEKEYLTDEEAAKASKEADWQCPYCGALNPAGSAECQSCGAAKEESEKNYHDLRKEADEKAAAHAALKAAHNDDARREMAEAENKASKKKTRRFIALGALIVLLIIGIVSCIPKTMDAEVTGIDWERSIAIQQYQNVEENDWSMPADATLVRKQQEVHHTEQVIDHYETVQVEKTREVQDGYDTEYRDLGNGNFEEIQTPRYVTETYYEEEQQPVYRDEPIYQTKYYYTIWKWVDVRSVDTAGQDHNPEWGNVTLASDEQEGARTEDYRITIKNEKGKDVTYSVAEDVWNQINVGDSLTIKDHKGSADELLGPDGDVIAELTEN